jgi:methionyl-tRNA formyltransferase
VRVLFWGTPEFATAPLRALLGEGFEVVAVVTQTDKPVGRSRSALRASAVKEVALREALPVLQPEKPKGDEFLAQLRELAPDVSVVVAYGHILPKAVIDLPRLGTLNIHASLLPALRGAAPIQAAIRDGLGETGVSIMQMVPALDAGPVLVQSETEVFDDETYGELQTRLAELGALTLLEALALIAVGKAKEVPQDESRATFAPKINRDAARINWKRSAIEIARLIRAFDPKPGAYTSSQKGDIKLFGPRLMDGISGKPGEVIKVTGELVIACGSDAIRIGEVQPTGKKRMAAHDWARGRGAKVGDRLGK